jgi:DNA-directed RNA polymerase specialized sigma subunit
MAMSRRGPYCLSCKRGEPYVDEMAVERAVQGQPPSRLSPAEREAAVIHLRLSTPLSYSQIAERAGCSERTVIRICKANGLLRKQRSLAA